MLAEKLGAKLPICWNFSDTHHSFAVLTRYNSCNTAEFNGTAAFNAS